MRRLPWKLLGAAALSTFSALANAQMDEQAAREQASTTARSELKSTIHFESNQFLGVQRDEALELSLAVAAGGRTGLPFIYKVSPAGYEVTENAVRYHTWMDFDPVFIVAVSPVDGSTYRIHEFGVKESLAEFQKLMTALRVRISSADQAESLTDFYVEVNPENIASPRISSLMELKQAAERQCHIGASSFDAGEDAFTSWWNHAKPLYADTTFDQTATSVGGGYRVEWIILSSPGPGNCGGNPLRERLEISSDGHVGKVTFSPLKNQ